MLGHMPGIGGMFGTGAVRAIAYFSAQGYLSPPRQSNGGRRAGSNLAPTWPRSSAPDSERSASSRGSRPSREQRLTRSL